jgi:4-hydroxybenzoate polyprenyltransferase
MDRGPDSRAWTAWLALIRPPNIPTVPGDPLAGFMLAASSDAAFWKALPCVAASVLLYMAGLVWNDCADYEKDRKERPDRPLPAGHVSRRAAALTGVGLAASGIGVSGFSGPATVVVAVVLAGLIVCYDFGSKRSRAAGSVNMGLCRGASLLLGASAAGVHALCRPPVVAAAAGITAYISAVTLIASRETRKGAVGVVRYVPVLACGVCLAVVLELGGALTFLPLALSAAAILRAWQCGSRLGGSPEPEVISFTIGVFLRALLLMHAAFCALTPGPGYIAAGLLLLLWPASAVLAKRFYAS